MNLPLSVYYLHSTHFHSFTEMWLTCKKLHVFKTCNLIFWHVYKYPRITFKIISISVTFKNLVVLCHPPTFPCCFQFSVSLFCYLEWIIEISNYNYWILYFFFQFCQIFLLVFGGSVIRCIHIYDFYTFLMYYACLLLWNISFSLETYLVFEEILL